MPGYGFIILVSPVGGDTGGRRNDTLNALQKYWHSHIHLVVARIYASSIQGLKYPDSGMETRPVECWTWPMYWKSHPHRLLVNPILFDLADR